MKRTAKQSRIRRLIAGALVAASLGMPTALIGTASAQESTRYPSNSGNEWGYVWCAAAGGQWEPDTQRCALGSEPEVTFEDVEE